MRSDLHESKRRVLTFEKKSYPVLACRRNRQAIRQTFLHFRSPQKLRPSGSKAVFVPTSGEHIPRQPCRHGSYRTFVMVYAHRLSSSCQFPAWSSRLHSVLLHSSRCSSLPLPLFSGLLCAAGCAPKAGSPNFRNRKALTSCHLKS